MSDERIYSSRPASGELAIGAPDLPSLDEGEERRLEVEVLVSEGAPSAALVEYLGDPDWRVRRAAAQGLADNPDADPSELLCKRLASEDAGERNAAIKALIKRGPASIPQLLVSLSSADPDVRNFTCIALGQIGDRSVTDALTGMLAIEPDANVRYMAIEALGRIADPRSADALVAILEEDVWFAAPAAEALGTIGGLVAVTALAAHLGDENLGLAAIQAMGATRDLRGLMPLLEAGSSADDLVAPSIVSAIGTLLAEVDDDCAAGLELLRSAARDLFSPALSAALVAMLARPGDARMRALRVAAWLGDPALTPAVCLAADDADSASLVTAFLARDLGAVMPYLPDGLKNPYPSVRIAIAEAIGAAADTSARQLLIPLLEDRNQAVTIAAVLALAAVGAAEDAACLTHLLMSELEETRLAAVSALRGLGVFCIVDTLAELAQSESPAVRATVARVLSVAPDTDEVPELCPTMLSLARDPDETVRAEIGPALGRAVCPDTVSALMSLALDECPGVRLAAIRALSGTNAGAASKALRTACADPSPTVRVAAIRGLAAQLSEEDVPLAVALLSDPEPGPVLTALRGLDSVDSEEITHAVVRLIEHESADVREAALRSLQRLAPNKGCTIAAVVLSGAEPAWNVRLAAVEALVGCDGDRDARPLLDLGLADDEIIVRRASVCAVPEVYGADGVRLLAALLGDEDLCNAARETLVRMGPAAGSALASSLPETRGDARRQMTRVLGAVQSPECRAALAALLAEGDGDDRWWAALGLAADGPGSHPEIGASAMAERNSTTSALLNALSGGGAR